MAKTAAERQAKYRAENFSKVKDAERARKKAHPERYTKYRRDTHRRHPGTRLLMLAKYRAKKNGLDFDITKEDFSVPEFCPILEIPIFVCERGFSDNSPTIDRIDNSRGYVKGNVRVISWRANRLKCDATPAELILLGEDANRMQR